MTGWIVLGIILLIMFIVLSPIAENLVTSYGGQDQSVSSIATRDAAIQTAVSIAFASGTRYVDYVKAPNNPPLTAWQFERLMNLARKKMLTTPNIDIVMGLK